MVSSPGTLWFYWVTIFWGIGRVFRALLAFGRDRFLGREWEEKMIQKLWSAKNGGESQFLPAAPRDRSTYQVRQAMPVG